MDLHGVPQGLSEVLLRPQRCRRHALCQAATTLTFFAASVSRPLARGNFANAASQPRRHGWRTTETTTGPPAERGRSAISLGLSQSAALNATAAGIREPNNALQAARETGSPRHAPPVTMEPLQRKAKPPGRAWARASKAFHAQNAIQLSEDWLDRFEELLAYRQRKGTFAAPPDTELGRWIKHQRQQHAAHHAARRGAREAGRLWILRAPTP